MVFHLKDFNDGAACFLVIGQVKKEGSEQQAMGISVVEEYTNVFPYEISRLSQRREVEFSIDLIPGAGLVSVAPYRMKTAELKELNK